MSPALPLSVLIPLAIVALAVVLAGAWRGSRDLATGRRVALLALRTCAVAAVFVFLWNPGKWVNPTEHEAKPWLLLVDSSKSMTQPAGNAGETRAAVAARLAKAFAARAERHDIPVRIQPFAGELLPALAGNESDLPAPDGESTRIVAAVSRALEESSASGRTLAGVLVAGDGRETTASDAAALEALALRARSGETPVHTVTIGTTGEPADLALRQPRAAFTTFAGQSLRVPFAVESTGLPALRTTATLRDADGASLDEVALDVSPGASVTGTFEVPAPAASSRWSIDLPVSDGELRPANNRSQFHVRVLDARTRVFLAEGAPYWDSKFLAQLLRQQTHMELRSIHRLSEKRYFRIDSGERENAETEHPVFPDTLEEISRYDLVVFGKNVDSFLTDERAALLRAYVRDHGGALLFSRGRATTAASAAIEPLEPVVWGPATIGSFRFAPNRDGESAGLFGQALAAPDASLWTSLPPLQDARQVAMVKPFTRVLADGMPDLPASAEFATGGKFPALLVRRYGQGVVAMINGDGLWKWDFFPDARELGNCYEDFWTQLIQWMAAYSEFLPGHDFSLRAPSGRAEAGSTVALTMSYRGADPVPQPLLEITGPDGESTRIRPAAIASPSERPLWRATLTPEAPGDWRIQLIDPREDAPPAPETLITVPAPPGESDDFTPDPAFMENLAEATGGKFITVDAFDAFLDEHVKPTPPAAHDAGAVWRASWTNAPTAILLALLLAAEWFIRRRSGLA
jgi:hypothetical protein